jgi:hypothetical protein
MRPSVLLALLALTLLAAAPGAEAARKKCRGFPVLEGSSYTGAGASAAPCLLTS